MKLKTYFFVLLLCMIGKSALAYDFKIGDFCYNYINNKTEVEIASAYSKDYNGKVIIPESVRYNNQDYRVTRIGKNALSNRSRVTSVTLHNGIESIGDNAFSACLHLTSIDIPESVKTIGNSAFRGCTGLQSVTIPSSVSTIEFMAFCECYDLHTVIISEGVETIGSKAFQSCHNLSHVFIPSSVTSIGLYAFENTPWQEAQIDGVIYSGTTAVGYNGTMPENAEIRIKEGTTAIGASAFSGMANLSSIILPKSLTTIEREAFYGCENLQYISMPENVVSIGYRAFYNCRSLGNISLPTGLQTIEEYAFYGCSSLESITIPEGITEIAGSAFSGCNNLHSIMFPANLVAIGTSAFGGCSSLIFLNLPANMKTIGSQAFSGCNSLISLDLPNMITEIGDAAFSSCSNLTSLKLPANLITIGSQAFYNCKALTRLTLPTTLESIGERAFMGCEELTSVIIPEKVSSIGNTPFYNCRNLKSIEVAQRNGVYDSRDNCNAIIETSSNTMIVGCQSSFIPLSATAIGPYAFDGCTGLTSITLPEGITSIGDRAFAFCTNLQSLVIPKSLTDIAPGALQGCRGLQTLKVAEGNPMYDSRNNCNAVIKTDNDLLVAGCSTTKIPDDIKGIGAYAFYGYHGVLSLPISVSSIESFAFANGNMVLLCESATPPTAKGNAFGDLDYGAFAIVPEDVALTYQEAVGWKKVAINVPFKCDSYFSTKLRLITSPVFNHPTATLNGITYTPENDTINIEHLLPGQTYEIEMQAYYGERLLRGTLQVTTQSRNVNVSVLNRTNETVTLKGSIYNPTNDFYPVASCGVEGYGEGEVVTISGLTPGKSYIFTYYVEGVDGSRYTKDIKVETQYVSLYAYGMPHASSCRIKGGYFNVIDAHIVEAGFKGYKQSEVVLTGLEADTKYTYTYEIKFANGESKTQDVVVYTDSLKFKTMPPRVLSPGNVIVAATSYLGEEEINAGFEWRRIDWPADFASNTAKAIIYKGTMEGYIHDLNTASLWKVRPYYESAAGRQYYGDWVGFDPTNTSYFEPTIHTYEQFQVKDNIAVVKGYVMQGTENVTSQGFVYWKMDAEAKAIKSYAPAQMVPIPNNAMVVTATGIVMEATLTDLEYNSVYCYAAFATTSEGKTYYGEQQRFTTGDDLTPVESIEASQSPVTIEAIYDTSGRKLAKMQRGINIVRMSDSTTKKVLIK